MEKRYSEFDFIIAVDPGVRTGLCIYNPRDGKIEELDTTTIHNALERVQIYSRHHLIFVRVEDARMRKWFGNKAWEKAQGAGSVKRDSKIWEDFLKDWQIPHEMVHPKDNKTKLGKAAFKKITGYEKRTSVHARDAAMMCWGL